MRLILEHAGQQVEVEFTDRDGDALTNQQATALIHYAFAAYAVDADVPANPTLGQKATFVAKVLAGQMAHAARQQRKAELNAANEEQLRSELG